MRQKQLGNTGLMVSALSYGGMALPGDLGEGEAARLLEQALALGINCIDTAPCYPGSEALIGRIAHRRGEFLLASKCGCHTDEAGNGAHVFTARTARRNVEESLLRMKTDHLDILQLHGATLAALADEQRILELIGALDAMKQEGKIGHYGVSIPHGLATDPDYPGRISARNMDAMLESYPWACYQVVYGGMTRDCELVIERARAAGRGIVARGSTRLYRADDADCFARSGAAELLEPGEDMRGFFIRFTLSHPGVDTVLIGTANAAHLLDNVRAAERGPLAPDVYAEAKRRFDGVGRTAYRPESARR